MTKFVHRRGYRIPDAADHAGTVSSPMQDLLFVRDSICCNVAPQLLGKRSEPISLGLRGGAGGQAGREGNTGTEFPSSFCHLSKSDCPSLVGFGSRKKRLLGVKSIDVYALGFYADEKAARQILKGKSSTADNLCKDLLEASDLEKTIRIVVTSKLVNHDRFVSSLKESLQPACQQAGDTESLPEFEKLFEETEFRKGLELAFTSTKSGSLAAKIDNIDIGEVRSPAFTKAFFSVYLGDSPVSPDAKKHIAKGLAELAKSSDAQLDLETETKTAQ